MGLPKTRPGWRPARPGHKLKPRPMQPTFPGRTPNRPKIRPVKFSINQNNVFKVVSAQQYTTEVIIAHIYNWGASKIRIDHIDRRIDHIDCRIEHFALNKVVKY